MAQWGGLVNIHAHILGTDKKKKIHYSEKPGVSSRTIAGDVNV